MNCLPKKQNIIKFQCINSPYYLSASFSTTLTSLVTNVAAIQQSWVSSAPQIFTANILSTIGCQSQILTPSVVVDISGLGKVKKL